MVKPPLPPSERPNCAVVVLGARVEPDGSPSPTVRRRVERAVALVKTVPAAVLVTTGGAPEGQPTEGEVMAALARRLGVPDDRMLIESQARNTRENARNTVDLLSGMGVSRIVVVSDAWHLPRAVMLFRRAARGAFRVRGCAAPARTGRVGWWVAALREVPAFAADLFRGRGL